MITVVGVRFKKAGKIYYFDPDELDIQKDDHVIVETARGIEFGHVVIGKRGVVEEEIVSPLKKVLRIATEEDVLTHQNNKAKNEDTFKICEEKILAHGLDMKLIDVEYTFDNNKVIFYFTADGRIDFRELVKDLAVVFKTRIELRQIGVRDEAKMVNGIGPCGVGLCCANWLGDFAPVSIKMAKDQNLSLNPTKISGICGRLMCCLKYEHETYQALRHNMPNKGDRVLTEHGEALVVDTSILLEQVKVRHVIKETNERLDLSEDIEIFKKHEIKEIIKKSPVVEEHDELIIENVEDIPEELLAEIQNELKNNKKRCGGCRKNTPNMSQIANAQGTKNGQERPPRQPSHASGNNRPNKPYGNRPPKNDRQEQQGERSEKVDRGPKTERSEKPFRKPRPDQKSKGDQGNRNGANPSNNPKQNSNSPRKEGNPT